MFLDRFLEFGRVDEISCAEFPGPFFLAVISIDCNNFLCPVGNAALDNAETNTSCAEDGTSGAILNLGSSGRSTEASGNAAA
jgi:hypothetical protein